jgi:UDP-N-acetylglucosamine:LPS N-acetylglucosamine transferase
VPAAGFEVTLLPGRGIARRLRAANIGAVAGLAAAVVLAVILVGRRRPSVVVAVGGYASVPCVVAAGLWRVPLVVAEQNAVPGLANRLAARLARASAVSFDGTDRPRAVLTGNPVRREMLAVDRTAMGRAKARAELGVAPDDLLVAVAGGSLGARRINEAVVGLAGDWAARPGWAVHHVVGERDWAQLQAAAPSPLPAGLRYQQVRYEDRMDRVYAASDVALHRAGASTVAELAVAGVPSILVPLPGAPGDHQTANARRLADAGAAVVVPDAELDAPRLEAELDRLAADRTHLAAMGAAAAALARPGAADAVADLVERYARG